MAKLAIATLQQLGHAMQIYYLHYSNYVGLLA